MDTMRHPYRSIDTPTRGYRMERVVVDGQGHYELTTTHFLTGDILEDRVVFNTKKDADAGLLDRACTI